MNFSVGDLQVGGPLGWLIVAIVALAPTLYLAAAWRAARRGSRAGIWGTAAAYVAGFVVLAVGSSLALPGPFPLVPTVAFAGLLLGPTVLACAAILHVAARPGGNGPGAGSFALAALLGYLAMPAGAILAIVVVHATMPGR